MTSTFARKLTILNQYGICARPAALFVKTASRFDADVTVSKGDQSVSGKSIMGLMTLEASQGTEVIVKATGSDAKEVVEEFTNLVNDGFSSGEGCPPIPKEHSEWTMFEPAPPPPPPIRFLRVAFAMGAKAAQERECLLRTVLPVLRQQCRPKRMRVRSLDLGKESRAIAVGGLNQPISLDDFEPPRPFYVLLCNQEARRLMSLDGVPSEIADLRGLLTGKSEDRPLSHEEINTLVRCYPWSNDNGGYVLRAGVSDEETAILETAFRRGHDYLREHCLILFQVPRSGPGEEPLIAQPEDLSDLRKHLDNYGWKYADYADNEAFGKVVSGVLTRWVEAEDAAGTSYLP